MVFQQFNLWPHKTVLENVMECPVQVKKANKEETKKKAMELLARVGMDGKADAYPTQLSGGQQQRSGQQKRGGSVPGPFFIIMRNHVKFTSTIIRYLSKALPIKKSIKPYP